LPKESAQQQTICRQFDNEPHLILRIHLVSYFYLSFFVKNVNIRVYLLINTLNCLYTEITIFGKVFAFTLQKFQALNRLTLAQRIELFFYNNSYTEVEQTNTDGLNSPEEWEKCLKNIIRVFFQEMEYHKFIKDFFE
jgi:hypothetical protein